jgi:hypothetical protein
VTAWLGAWLVALLLKTHWLSGWSNWIKLALNWLFFWNHRFFWPQYSTEPNKPTTNNPTDANPIKPNQTHSNPTQSNRSQHIASKVALFFLNQTRQISKISWHRFNRAQANNPTWANPTQPNPIVVGCQLFVDLWLVGWLGLHWRGCVHSSHVSDMNGGNEFYSVEAV